MKNRLTDWLTLLAAFAGLLVILALLALSPTAPRPKICHGPAQYALKVCAGWWFQ
jgi:hypothetical protein